MGDITGREGVTPVQTSSTGNARRRIAFRYFPLFSPAGCVSRDIRDLHGAGRGRMATARSDPGNESPCNRALRLALSIQWLPGGLPRWRESAHYSTRPTNYQGPVPEPGGLPAALALSARVQRI